ncbi:hypothetical protein FG476_05750 [Xylella fastidiosa subsp. multiplex]|uniref:Uncharacterized protein n=1 Tax=Xylella fastidiosa subsp. multiplex TaxID=644357 RepID=A0A9Q4QSK8_XYLFS|nr:hypothetical protein [Xylella fastidiosa]ACA12882.1 conserved hypothetical protein [Xylella fastidiosa M12]KAJ4853593.1 hypothetical protein XYFPCFBP8418_004950 [Xylella fastidiosa subsp. multiplex]MBE0276205.1 hypothetical protein [Xylella fastidiosa subsp. multiplex]MBE0278419.1 hypothetical protein [Xylella fastidiosa subsp. multiplex]MDC6407519.1 hypothetical protein [Xylella fastidiosa subsp. multiplex]
MHHCLRRQSAPPTNISDTTITQRLHGVPALFTAIPTHHRNSNVAAHRVQRAFKQHLPLSNVTLTLKS